MTVALITIDDCPGDVQLGIREFWQPEEWNNAANIGNLESHLDPFAVRDTRRSDAPCGAVLYVVDGIAISAELSVGIFQINACNFPGWEWQRFYNIRHNCGTAHLIWTFNGWNAWYYSAQALGLLH